MKTFELNISIAISSNQGDRLHVTETVQVIAGDFLDIAKILGQFHDLATILRIKHPQEKRT